MITGINFNETAIKEGLEYILGHFEHQMHLWPRTISTKTTEGRQIIAYSKDETLARFKQANFMDCRISAYPYWRPSITSEFIGIKNTIAPNFIMIDLDLNKFDLDDEVLTNVLRQTLRKIKEILQLHDPTVIWSGNGYHIYIPINAPVLENIKEFSSIEQISTKFIRFAEWYLSNGKSDPAHNNTVSLNNCLLRIPGSINSKNNAQVKIVNRFNGKTPTPSINLLIGSFYAHISDQEIRKSRYKKAITQISFHNNNKNNDHKSIYWIEKLLQTPLADFRKKCIWRILAPYLINVRKLSYEESFGILVDWLEKCSKVRRLYFNPKLKIKQDLNGAIKARYYPIGLIKLSSADKELYECLFSERIIDKNVI
jgi:hypothetical protein